MNQSTPDIVWTSFSFIVFYPSPRSSGVFPAVSKMCWHSASSKKQVSMLSKDAWQSVTNLGQIRTFILAGTAVGFQHAIESMARWKQPALTRMKVQSSKTCKTNQSEWLFGTVRNSPVHRSKPSSHQGRLLVEAIHKGLQVALQVLRRECLWRFPRRSAVVRRQIHELHLVRPLQSVAVQLFKLLVLLELTSANSHFVRRLDKKFLLVRIVAVLPARIDNVYVSGIAKLWQNTFGFTLSWQARS